MIAYSLANIFSRYSISADLELPSTADIFSGKPKVIGAIQ